MQKTLLHKLVSLMLTALLLMQFAPFGEWAKSVHKEGCTHCTGTYCLRKAKGEKCDHKHGHADASHSTASHHATEHASNHSAGHGVQGSQFCTCDHQHQVPVGTLAFDKVVHADPVSWHKSPANDLHFAPLQTLNDQHFVDEQFRPPWLHG